MMNLKHRNQLKWVIFYGMILILYVIQTTPALLSFGGIKPMLLIPFAVAVACFEQPLQSGIFGMICGLFTDAASGYLLGFNAIIMLICCVLISLIHTNYLKSRLLDSLISCLVVLLIQRSLDYFFYYAIWGLDPEGYLLLHRFLPTAVFSLSIIIPMHYAVKLLVNKMKQDDYDLKIER